MVLLEGLDVRDHRRVRRCLELLHPLVQREGNQALPGLPQSPRAQKEPRFGRLTSPRNVRIPVGSDLRRPDTLRRHPLRDGFCGAYHVYRLSSRQLYLNRVFDGAGRLATVTMGTSQPFRAAYDANRRLGTLALPNRSIRTHSYNPPGDDLASISYADRLGNALGSFTYTYDRAGRVQNAAGSFVMRRSRPQWIL